MIGASKTVTINAPVEKVFAFMENPANLPEIWPSMIDVTNIKEFPDNKYTYDWTYKMAGMKFHGAAETLEYMPNKRIVVKTTKGIESEFKWDYRPEGDGTKLTVEVEYNVPIPLVGKLAESLIVRQNEREAEILLDNLKMRMEA